MNTLWALHSPTTTCYRHGLLFVSVLQLVALVNIDYPSSAHGIPVLFPVGYLVGGAPCVGSAALWALQPSTSMTRYPGNQDPLQILLNWASFFLASKRNSRDGLDPTGVPLNSIYVRRCSWKKFSNFTVKRMHKTSREGSCKIYIRTKKTKIA